MAHPQIGHINSKLNVNSDSLLVQCSRVYGPLQIVVPLSLRQRILMLQNYPQIARHTRQCHKCDTLRHEFFGFHINAFFERIVSNCQSLKRNSPTYGHKRKLQHFLAAGPLEVLAIDNPVPLSKPTQQNPLILVIIDCYSKIAHVLPTSRKKSL